MKNKASVTFEDFDCFELSKFCERLEGFVNVEHDYVEGSLVLALDGGFGSGKSTFIEMWSNRLLSHRENGKFVPMPIMLNAWESDHCGEPLLAVLAGLVEALKSWKGEKIPNESKLKDAAKDVGWFATGLMNECVAKFTGIDVVKAGEYATKQAVNRKPKSPNFIEIYQQRIDALRKLKMELNEAFGGPQPKVLVFVDELDRCRPDYAVAYLETIKHVFDIEGMVFILSVDYGQLEVAVKALFGDDLKFEDYFRKFSHRTIALPKVAETSYRKITQSYIGKYLSVEGKRMSRIDFTQGIKERVVELAYAFHMRPRQIQEAFRIMGHTMQTLDHNYVGNLKWGYAAGCVLLSFLRVTDMNLFCCFRGEENGLRDLCQKLVDVLGLEEAEWWVQLAISGTNSHGRSASTVIQMIIDLGYEIDKSVPNNRFLYGFHDAWNHDPKQLVRLANMIEEVQTF